jgi:hypothetical protein
VKSEKAVEKRRVRRLVVPVVLTVTVLGAAAAAVSSVGCGDDVPAADAAVDSAPDTPII